MLLSSPTPCTVFKEHPTISLVHHRPAGVPNSLQSKSAPRWNHSRLGLWITAVVAGATLTATPQQATAAGLPISSPAAGVSVDYNADIAPMLAANCTACHNAQRSEGGLRLDSLAAITVGGDSGPAAISKNAAQSPLFLRAAHREEDFMPPPDNEVGARSLTADELGVLERWIETGLAAGASPVAAPIAWVPLQAGAGGLPAVAISPDGRTVAAARGGRVELIESGTGTSLGLLSTPDLPSAPAADPPLAHLDIVTAIAFAPDGEQLATGSFRTIRLWQRQPPTRQAVMPSGAKATAIARDDGGLIAIGREDGQVVLLKDGATDLAKPIVTLAGHQAAVVLVTLLTDENLLASVAADGSVLVHHIPDGNLVGTLTLDKLVACAAIPGTDVVAVARKGEQGIGLWRLPRTLSAAAAEPAQPVKTIRAVTEPITLMSAPARPADRLLVTNANGLARLIDLSSDREVGQFAHGGPIAAVTFSSDGNQLATAGAGGLKLWNIPDGKQLAEYAGDPRSDDRCHELEDDIAVLKQAVTRAEQAVEAAKKTMAAAVTDRDKTAQAVPPAEKLAQEKQQAAQAAATAVEQANATVAAAKESAAASTDPQAKTALDAAVAAATAKDKAQQDAVAAAEKADRDLVSAQRAAAFAVEQLARTEKQLAVATANLSSTQESLAAIEKASAEADAHRKAARRPIVSVAFLSDGRRIASLDDRGLVVLFAAADGQPRTAWWPIPSDAHQVDIGKAGLLLDGGRDRLIVAQGTRPAGIWQTGETWSLIHTIGGEKTPPTDSEDPTGPPVAAVLALAFSPTGTELASGSGLSSRTGEIKLWNPASGSLLRTLQHPHSDTVTSLAFARDGRQLASGSTDRTAKIFSLPDGTRLRAFEGHSGHVLGVAWQADGTRLATAGGDNVVKIWETTTGEQQRTIGGFNKEVTAVKFSGVSADLLAASGGSLLSLLNANDGKTIRQFTGISGFIQTLGEARGYFAAGTATGQLGGWQVAEPAARWTYEPVAAE